MRTRGQRLRLGIFVVVSFAALGGLIIIFGGAPNLLGERISYTVTFPDASGVTPGTPISRAGVKIGTVRRVELDPETGLVRVGIEVDPRFPPRSKEEVTITRGLIGTDAAIEFLPRTDGKRPPDLGEPLPIGSIIVGVPPTTPRELLAQAGGVLPSAQASLDQIRRSLGRVDELITPTREAITEFRDFTRAARELLPELRRTNDTLRDSLAGFRNLGPEATAAIAQIRATAVTYNQIGKDVQELLRRNETVVNQSLRSLAASLDNIAKLTGPENQQAIADVLRDLQKASKQIEPLLAALAETGKELRLAAEAFRKIMPQLELIVGDVRTTTKALAQRADGIAENLEVASQTLNRTLSDVRTIVKAIGAADGTFHRFISDATLYNNLLETTASINKLMPSLERILRDAEVFADKLARHPEILGISGAVRPSGGLKESPGSSSLRPRQ